MRRFALFVLLFILVATVFNYIFVIKADKTAALKADIHGVEADARQGLPWQINKLASGVQVFSLTLGSTTLQQAIEVLGKDFELALMARPNELGSVELFYPRFVSGMLKGKLIVVVDVDAGQIATFLDNTNKVKHLETGAKQYVFVPAQHPELMQASIKAITFAPVARLNDEMVRSRFGEPSSINVIDEDISHYLYPEKSVVVIINQAGKDFIEYSLPSI